VADLQTSLLESVIRHMPEGVIVAEAPSGKVLVANDSVQRILGNDYELGSEWPVQRVLAGEVVDRQDIVVRGETTNIVRCSGAPIRNGDGRVIAAVVTFFDVTTERRERDALALLTDISAIADSLRLTETLQRISNAAVPKFADLVAAHLVDDRGELQRHELAAADPVVREIAMEVRRRFPLPSDALRAVLETGRSHLIASLPPNFLESFRDAEHRALISKLGMRSVINVAMRASGRTFGVMTYVRTAHDRPFDELDVLIAEEIAGRGAEAVEKSRLFEREREQRVRAEQSAKRIESLQMLGSSLATAMTIDDVVDTVIHVLGRVVSARGLAIALVRDEQSIEVVRSTGYDAAVTQQYRIMPLDSALPIPRAAATRTAIWMRTRSERHLFAPLLDSLQTPNAAWAALPLELHGNALGAIGLSFAEEQTFAEEERNFLMSIAGQCAIALERANLFESERRAREEAERASRAKDEFLAILSHELRTPMTTVIGWADFLKMTYANDADLIGPLDALRSSAKVQAKLVDDLLDVSRIIAGKLAVTKRDMELTSVVRTAVEDAQMSARDKGVDVESDLPLEPLRIHGDPDRVRQIVSNLLVNGIKFTPRGGLVTVSVREQGDDAEIAVKDTGEGISPEFLPHVFDRFRQGSVGDSRRHSGLGLGLSIVQHLAQRHGGSVKAESDGLGRGACFRVRLPRRS
jgi:signal transduction histidine kinase